MSRWFKAGMIVLPLLSGCADLDKMTDTSPLSGERHVRNEKLKGCKSTPAAPQVVDTPGAIASTPSPSASDTINCPD